MIPKTQSDKTTIGVGRRVSWDEIGEAWIIVAVDKEVTRRGYSIFKVSGVWRVINKRGHLFAEGSIVDVAKKLGLVAVET